MRAPGPGRHVITGEVGLGGKVLIVESHRQAPRRRHIAKQDIADRLAALRHGAAGVIVASVHMADCTRMQSHAAAVERKSSPA